MEPMERDDIVFILEGVLTEDEIKSLLNQSKAALSGESRILRVVESETELWWVNIYFDKWLLLHHFLHVVIAFFSGDGNTDGVKAICNRILGEHTNPNNLHFLINQVWIIQPGEEKV